MALLRNKKATFDYQILQTFEAGLELFGHEVKSLRAGKGSLVGSHVLIRGNEAFLVNATIQPYQEGNTPEEYDPTRYRRLLLNKKELIELEKAEDTNSLTIVPISVYNKGRRLKLEIAIARGKKQHDKREVIKKRDTERDLRRSLKIK